MDEYLRLYYTVALPVAEPVWSAGGWHRKRRDDHHAGATYLQMRTVGELRLRARRLADCGAGDISVLCAGGRLGNVWY